MLQSSRVDFQRSEYEGDCICAVSAVDMDAKAAAVLGEVIALPTQFHAGGTLLEIDRHITVCTPNSWITEALLNGDADWIPQEVIDGAARRRDELEQALGEAEEERDAGEDALERAHTLVYGTPSAASATVSDSDLKDIPHDEQPNGDHSPPLQNTFHPLPQPTGSRSSVR